MAVSLFDRKGKSLFRALGLGLGLALGACATASSSELQGFLGERGQYATALTEPIAICVQRHDTENPVFHGCIDWHSSVHGTWALVAYSWATGDQQYKPIVDAELDPALIEKERQHLDTDLKFEMPYGRAWFLRLAIDYRRAYGSDLLRPMADDIAASLVQHYTDTPPAPESVAYQNASWALINLYDYGQATGNTKLTDFVRAQITAHYLGDAPCPVHDLEETRGEFMAVCTNWAWLVSLVLPPDKFKPWLDGFLPGDPPLEPVTVANTAHLHGLNFSRAWGLWRLYRATGEERFLKAYLAHFQYTYSRPDDWKGDYHTVAHWVAQFGMFALMESYYDFPPTMLPASATH